MTASSQADPGRNAETLVEAGELDAAIALLRQETSRSALQSKYLAWLELQRGDYSASAATLEELLRRDPHDAEARLSLGFAHWYRGDLSAAAATIGRIEQQDSTVDAGLLERAQADQERLRGELQDMRGLAASQDRVAAVFTGLIALVVVISIAAVVTAARASRRV